MDQGSDGRDPTTLQPGPEMADWAEALIGRRQTTLPKRLESPGPDDAQLERICAAAAAAPDHGELVPWRFILIPPSARSALADAFEASLLQRDTCATELQRQQSREKAFRAPVLLIAVARLNDGQSPIPDIERLVSAGCAVQNMLLVATAMGFGSALTSGQALQSVPMRSLLRLDANEAALCFLNFGTPTRRKAPRNRSAVGGYCSVLTI